MKFFVKIVNVSCVGVSFFSLCRCIWMVYINGRVFSLKKVYYFILGFAGLIRYYQHCFLAKPTALSVEKLLVELLVFFLLIQNSFWRKFGHRFNFHYIKFSSEILTKIQRPIYNHWTDTNSTVYVRVLVKNILLLLVFSEKLKQLKISN